MGNFSDRQRQSVRPRGLMNRECVNGMCAATLRGTTKPQDGRNAQRRRLVMV